MEITHMKVKDYPLIVVKDEKCTMYRVYYASYYYDELGRKYRKVRKIQTYNSIEDMEADFNGFINFIEYEESEAVRDDEYRLEQSKAATSNEQRGFDRRK